MGLNIGLKEGRLPWLIVGICVTAIGFLVFLGFIVNPVIPGVSDNAIKDAFVVSTQEMATAKDAPPEADDSKAVSSYYLYNMTNADDVANFKATPEYESIGPFKYNVIQESVGSTYNKEAKLLSYKSKSTFEFIVADSPSLDSLITNIDIPYTQAFPERSGPSESAAFNGAPLLVASALNEPNDNLGGLSVALYILRGQVADLVGSSDEAQLTAKLAEILANLRSLSRTDANDLDIDANGKLLTLSFDDLLYLQYGASVFGCKGNANAVSGPTDCGFQMLLNTKKRETREIAARAILSASYLTEEEKIPIIDGFATDSAYLGMGLYQVMLNVEAVYAARLTPPSSPTYCQRLTLAKSKSVHKCLFKLDCGRNFYGTLAFSIGRFQTAFAAASAGSDREAIAAAMNILQPAYDFVGLTATNPGDLCYLRAFGAYTTVGTQPLFKWFLEERLMKEKGTRNLMMEVKTAREILDGYMSPTANAFGLDPEVAGLAQNSKLEDIEASLTVVRTGEDDTRQLNTLVSINNGRTGWDYNKDGKNVSFVGAHSGSPNFPPNQDGLSDEPLSDTIVQYESDLKRTCNLNRVTTKIPAPVSVPPFKAEWYRRDDATCFAKSDLMGVPMGGYISQTEITDDGFLVWSTPSCMRGFVDQKMWEDDCPDDLSDHAAEVAIEPNTGQAVGFRLIRQIVFGAPEGEGIFDVNTGFTARHFPLFRVAINLELSDKDKNTFDELFAPLLFLQDTIAWVLLGLGILIMIPGIVLIVTSIEWGSGSGSGSSQEKEADASTEITMTEY